MWKRRPRNSCASRVHTAWRLHAHIHSNALFLKVKFLEGQKLSIAMAMYGAIGVFKRERFFAYVKLQRMEIRGRFVVCVSRLLLNDKKEMFSFRMTQTLTAAFIWNRRKMSARSTVLSTPSIDRRFYDRHGSTPQPRRNLKNGLIIFFNYFTFFVYRLQIIHNVHENVHKPSWKIFIQ